VRPVQETSWLWIGPLLGTLALQTTAAFLGRLIPTLAPAFSSEFGWSQTAVGYLAGIGTLGSIVFLLAGNPLIRRVGPIRTLQYGLALGGIGAVLLTWPTLVVAAVASFLIGLGYGPSAPAGSEPPLTFPDDASAPLCKAQTRNCILQRTKENIWAVKPGIKKLQ